MSARRARRVGWTTDWLCALTLLVGMIWWTAYFLEPSGLKLVAALSFSLSGMVQLALLAHSSNTVTETP